MKRFDTEGLEWRPAFRRATLFVGLWLLTIYALSTAFPDSFYLGLDSSSGIISLVVNGILFFILMTLVTAFAERRKKRARAGRHTGQGTQKQGKPPKAGATSGAEGDQNGEAGPNTLKGRSNPNTSRKKSSRRRRR
jgi:hypothetical protein